MPGSRRVRATTLLCALIGFSATTALANGGPVEDWGGNNIAPMQNCNVRLVRECVHVDLGPGGGKVECRYYLVNLDERDTTIAMTFIRGREPGRKFRAWIGEREADVRWMQVDFRHWGKYTDGDLDSLPVWDLDLAAGDTLSIRCEYPTRLDRDSWGTGWSSGFAYRTQSAALWAGTIESAEFVIELGREWRLFACSDPHSPPYVAGHIEPTGYQWVGSTLRWRFTDWEPSEDIIVSRFDAHALSPEDFFTCWPMSSADCIVPIELPPYASDSTLLEREAVLAAICRGFVQQGAAEPLPQNYHAYAVAFLQATRLEIDARNGGVIEETAWARQLVSELGYRPRGDFSPSDLSATERANSAFLREMEREIDQDPSALLPLPPAWTISN